MTVCCYRVWFIILRLLQGRNSETTLVIVMSWWWVKMSLWTNSDGADLNFLEEGGIGTRVFQWEGVKVLKKSSVLTECPFSWYHLCFFVSDFWGGVGIGDGLLGAKNKFGEKRSYSWCLLLPLVSWLWTSLFQFYSSRFRLIWDDFV